MDPIKVAGIVQWPEPWNNKDIQSFLGFGNFYCQFIQGFSKIACPLFDLTKKSETWVWTPECQAAFEALKNVFTYSPVLVMLNPDKPYCVEVNASNYATKEILAQLRANKQWHLVAYLFQSLLEPKRNYNIHNKELLAIIWALEFWRHYLEGAFYPVDIITNHKNLKYFTNLQKLSRLQAQLPHPLQLCPDSQTWNV